MKMGKSGKAIAPCKFSPSLDLISTHSGFRARCQFLLVTTLLFPVFYQDEVTCDRLRITKLYLHELLLYKLWSFRKLLNWALAGFDDFMSTFSQISQHKAFIPHIKHSLRCPVECSQTHQSVQIKPCHLRLPCSVIGRPCDLLGTIPVDGTTGGGRWRKHG